MSNTIGGPLIPVLPVADTMVTCGPAIPVWLYLTQPPGSIQSGAYTKRVKIIGDPDLIWNGGQYWLEGRPFVMPVMLDPTGFDEGNIAIPVYIVGVSGGGS